MERHGGFRGAWHGWGPLDCQHGHGLLRFSWKRLGDREDRGCEQAMSDEVERCVCGEMGGELLKVASFYTTIFEHVALPLPGLDVTFDSAIAPPCSIAAPPLSMAAVAPAAELRATAGPAAVSATLLGGSRRAPFFGAPPIAALGSQERMWACLQALVSASTPS